MKPKKRKNCRYLFGVLLLGILIWVGLLEKTILIFNMKWFRLSIVRSGKANRKKN